MQLRETVYDIKRNKKKKKQVNMMVRKYWLLVILLLMSVSKTYADDVTFSLNAPAAVVKNGQFRIAYKISSSGSGEGKVSDLNVPDNMKGFDILFGPATSQSSSTTMINGKTTSEISLSYVYTLQANEVGTFTIPGATVKVDGKTYTASAKQVKVLPPDKGADASQPGQQPQAMSSTSTIAKFDPKDAFVRAIFSKTKIAEQEAVTVTFRFYSVLNIRNVGKIEFPEFEGFMTDEFELPVNRQWTMEHYNGRNYQVIDVKKTLLFPQRSGKITIPSGKMEFVFEVKTGQKIRTFFGTQEVMTEARQVLKTTPVTVDVSPLPDGKPASFSGAIGSFTFTPSITAQKVTANEPVTIKVDIKGTGNLKLIKNPEIVFPKEFETYDPKINNDYKVSEKGQAGVKTVEYMFIPRSPGNYTIAPIEFSFYDLDSRSYKTLSSPAYTLEVAKDPNAGSNTSATSYMNKNEVKVEQDIRYLKTNKFSFRDSNHFFVGTLSYILWFVIPFVLFLILFIVYRNQIKANADLTRMRTRRANKVATKRLKLAKKYLQMHNKDGFYDEVLRAVWGYLSDKLTIAVSELSRENVGNELTRYGATDELITQFISILDTCEFARYAPAESDKAMDNLYEETVDAIGKMENGKTVNSQQLTSKLAN